MKSLKELVAMQGISGRTDTEIIAQWYDENDMALAGIEIVYNIAKEKIKSIERSINWIVGDLSMYDGTECLVKAFGIEDGIKLDKVTRLWIMEHRANKDFEIDYPKQFEWLKEFIPTKKQPLVFWRNFIDWLNYKGIYFKDQTKKF